jgi:transglutaminase-like putative cysteine protease
MSLEIRGQQRARPQRSLDVIVWLLLALLFAPVVVAARLLPWAHGLLSWTIPALAGVGLAIGVILVVAPLAKRWWWIPLGVAPLLGAAVAAGVVITRHGAGSAPSGVGTTVFGAYLVTLGAMLPWLVFRAAQPWLAVVAVWLTVVGAWGTKLTTQQVWWLVWMLAISLVLLGMCHLRQEASLWREKSLQRLGPVLWPSARMIILVSLLIATVGLVPLGAARLAALNAALRHSPVGQGGPLTYSSKTGAPVAILGAPLTLDAPDVSDNHIVLTYSILEGPIEPPPLLGATLDTFDGVTWTLSPAVATAPAGASLALPTDAQTLKTRVTVYALPKAANGTMLLSFDQPLAFSVPTQVSLVASGAPTAVSIAGWQTSQTVAHGYTYTTTSAVLPATATGSGALPPALVTRMTQLPAPLDAATLATARQWIASAKTPADQANALLAQLTKVVQLDPTAIPPAGADAVTWALGHKRANALLLTTTYIELARALGLPMRLAEGYLPGVYDTKLQQTVVRTSDATVWAQLAVPGEGWLDYFPIANAITVTVPSKVVYNGIQPTVTPAPSPTALATQGPNQPKNARRVTTAPGAIGSGGTALVVALAVAALLLLLVSLLLYLRWRWSRFGAQFAPLTQFFARVALLARLGGVRLRASDTSTQATGKLVAYMPDHRETLTTLNTAYERARYGPPEERGIFPNIRDYWRRLSRAMWRLVMTRPWRRGSRQGSNSQQKG